MLVKAFLACTCHAQQWEIGAGGGYGIYRNASIYAPAGQAAAGFRNRFVLTAVFGEDLYRRIAGEVRYTYQDGDPFIEAGSVRANVQGQSHAFHYDVLVHTRGRDAILRPYLALGAGAKLYRVTGPANPNQALGAIGRLASQDEIKPLVTAGGGVRFRLRQNLVVRLDFRDYVTPFPKNVIQPAPLGTARGIFHQFTPMLGVGMLF